jgi:hypothetical protein
MTVRVRLLAGGSLTYREGERVIVLQPGQVAIVPTSVVTRHPHRFQVLEALPVREGRESAASRPEEELPPEPVAVPHETAQLSETAARRRRVRRR